MAQVFGDNAEIVAGELATPTGGVYYGDATVVAAMGLGRMATATKDGIARLISGRDA